MQLEANDMLQAIASQRNGALDENVQLHAMVKMLTRQVEELQKELAAEKKED